MELEILRRSKKFVLLLLVGIVIAYINLGAQERLAVCGPDECEEQALAFRQLLGSGLITAALIYFYNLTRNTAAASGFCDESANEAYTAGALNLIAGLIRLSELLEK